MKASREGQYYHCSCAFCLALPCLALPCFTLFCLALLSFALFLICFSFSLSPRAELPRFDSFHHMIPPCPVPHSQKDVPRCITI